ncbi:hypothetical protein QUC31_002054 [Theobroma cacao]
MSGDNYSIHLLLVPFLALVLFLQKPTKADVLVQYKESERQALLDLGISSWGSENDKRDFCTWNGVECSNSTGHVVKLDLSGVVGFVEGTISPSLLKLRYLNHLDLSFFNFSCRIPEFIGSLTELTYLALSNSHIIGPIPSQLGNLLRLVTLDLSSNPLGSSIPEFIGSLTKLTYLDLSESQLTGPIPSQLGNLSRLVTLDLSSNQLTGSIPETFGNLVAIRELTLSRNLLQGGIPLLLWNICSLHSLDLQSNNLGGDVFGFLQSTSLCTTHSLENLDLTENQFTGSVPNEITKLSSLQVLGLGYNRLNGTISQGMGQMSNLTTLKLAGNSFDKVVISEAHFSNLRNLRELDLSDTCLTLKFKSDWIPPFQLRLIFLRSCKLGPLFPQWLRSQNACFEIDISAAEISDSIPSWFWNVFSFPTCSVNLSFNQLSGTLPSNRIVILFLDLSSNNLTGPLPQMTNWLSTLNLSKNKFSGSIKSICNIPAKLLKLLDLSNNLFSGVIPDCLARWRLSLKALNLAENNLSGSIPRSIGSLRILRMLSLRGNSFSGPFPSSLGNCFMLEFLDFSDNKLSGNIPEWIGESFSILIFLSLQNNQFNGTIPHQICGLNNIQILDLSVNKLSGTLPRCLNKFTSMAQDVNLSRTIEHRISRKMDPNAFSIDVNYVDEALFTWKGKKQKYARILGLLLAIDLSNNRLTGEIPEELTSLRQLVALNLSRNFLSGKIPWKIGQIRQLQSLDLSRNNFSGSIPSSLSEITFLSTLDLSYNYLSGKIPTGTQIQLFDPSTFSHNHALCGPPVTPNCSGSAETPQGQPRRGQDDFDEFRKWFYAGMGLGFIVGFWGICGALLFKRSWRHAYFRFLDNMKDWLYVRFVLQKARLERRIRT